jgi:hypothetical protein
MSLVRYPVAASPELAVSSPLGYAVRASEAARLADTDVDFVSLDMGPLFETRQAAQEAWRELLDGAQLEEAWRKLRETVVPSSGRMPGAKLATPAFEAGRRWPAPMAPRKTVWRLNVTFWRPLSVAQVAAAQTGLKQARKARRDPGAEHLDPAALRAMADQPLSAQRLQKGLDIGLFEVRAPEAPDRLIADE